MQVPGLPHRHAGWHGSSIRFSSRRIYFVSGPSVHWDAENTHHILVEHGDRNISTAEVEEVLLSTDTVKWMTKRGGRFKAFGRTARGRWLIVIYSGIDDLRPVTAWATPDKGGSRHG